MFHLAVFNALRMSMLINAQSPLRLPVPLRALVAMSTTAWMASTVSGMTLLFSTDEASSSHMLRPLSVSSPALYLPKTQHTSHNQAHLWVWFPRSFLEVSLCWIVLCCRWGSFLCRPFLGTQGDSIPIRWTRCTGDLGFPSSSRGWAAGTSLPTPQPPQLCQKHRARTAPRNMGDIFFALISTC